jgi:hypothetical protein
MAGTGAELLASPKVRAAYLEGGARKSASITTDHPSRQEGGTSS